MTVFSHLRWQQLFCVLLMTLAVSVSAEEVEVDPWESWNRSVMRFNDQLDRYFMKPTAKGYQAVMPTMLDNGVSNAFAMIGEIPSAGNALLQGKPGNMGRSISRFLINATLGFFGIFDVATALGIEREKEDFGQTLATWGVPDGPYLVLPFLGPSTVRDTAGLVPDIYLDPLNIDHVPTRNTSYAVKFVDLRADLLTAEGLITGDRYIFLRNAYLQQREYLIKDGEVVDSFGEEELEDDWLDADEEF